MNRGFRFFSYKYLVQTPLQFPLSISLINAVHKSLIHHCLLEAYLFFEKEKLGESFENSRVVHPSRSQGAPGVATKTSERWRAAPPFMRSSFVCWSAGLRGSSWSERASSSSNGSSLRCRPSPRSWHSQPRTRVSGFPPTPFPTCASEFRK